MDFSLNFQQLGISLGLGLLVGLQRQRSDSQLAGFRTFPLVTLFGTICAQLAGSYGGWLVAAGLVSLAGLIVVGNLARIRRGAADPGLTTEVAMVLMFCVGAYLAVGEAAEAVAVGAGVAVLLHLKPQMHSLAAKIGESDFHAIMQFVLITLVILPVLPDRTYGPYAVFNPHRVWLLVVLIVGLSLAGYVAYKLFGQRVGALIGGILGGLISSTATTVGYSRRVTSSPAVAGLSALVIAIASTVVFFRVIVVIGVTSPSSFARIAPPLAVMFGILAACVGGMFLLRRPERTGMPPQGNPSEMRSAVVFALLFTVVLFAVAAAQEMFGSQGLYVVAILSGLTDMDAITLSTMQMTEAQRVDPDTAWRVILAAALSNLLFKCAMVIVLGRRLLFARLAVYFGISILAGVLILFLWPPV